jgi:hypothetical protein
MQRVHRVMREEDIAVPRVMTQRAVRRAGIINRLRADFEKGEKIEPVAKLHQRANYRV